MGSVYCTQEVRTSINMLTKVNMYCTHRSPQVLDRRIPVLYRHSQTVTQQSVHAKSTYSAPEVTTIDAIFNSQTVLAVCNSRLPWWKWDSDWTDIKKQSYPMWNWENSFRRRKCFQQLKTKNIAKKIVKAFSVTSKSRLLAWNIFRCLEIEFCWSSARALPNKFAQISFENEIICFFYSSDICLSFMVGT